MQIEQWIPVIISGIGFATGSLSLYAQRKKSAADAVDTIADAAAKGALNDSLRIDKLMARVDVLENSGIEKDAIITSLTEKVHDFEKKVGEKDSTISDLGNRVHELEKSGLEKDTTIAALTVKVRDLETAFTHEVNTHFIKLSRLQAQVDVYEAQVKQLGGQPIRIEETVIETQTCNPSL